MPKLRYVILFEMGLLELGEKRKEMGCFFGSKKNLKTVTSMDGWRCMAGWIVPKGRSWDNILYIVQLVVKNDES